MTDQIIPADPTIAELRAGLITSIAENAAFDGWTPQAVTTAAEQHGVDPDLATLAFRDGPVDMIDAWFAHVDAHMAAEAERHAITTMKVRERITRLIEWRLDIVGRERESLRRALAILAMPQNAPQAARLSWRAADLMWRLAGDTATDFNHYTKRLSLSAVYASTIAAMMADDSEDLTETRAFLARRIDNVMQFEKLKARFKGRNDEGLSLSRFIGRLRYPAR